MGGGEIREQLVSEAARSGAAVFLDPVELARVRAMPGFEAYMRRGVAIWRAPAGDDVILASTLRDLGRFISGIWALFLNATPGGMTLARLSDLLEQTGISSPGRARSMMIFLSFIKYIEPAPQTGDARLRVFRPTVQMAAAFHERYRLEFVAAAPLDADIAAALARIDEPAFFNALMAALGELSLAGFQLFDRTEVSLDVISHRYAGMTVVGELLAAADRDGGPFPPIGPVRFAMAGLAKSCDVSRTQVRRILQAGAGAGFFELKGEGELVLTPLLAEHIELLVACSFMMFQWTCKQALASSPARTAAA